MAKYMAIGYSSKDQWYLWYASHQPLRSAHVILIVNIMWPQVSTTILEIKYENQNHSRVTSQQ